MRDEVVVVSGDRWLVRRMLSPQYQANRCDNDDQDHGLFLHEILSFDVTVESRFGDEELGGLGVSASKKRWSVCLRWSKRIGRTHQSRAVEGEKRLVHRDTAMFVPHCLYFMKWSRPPILCGQ